MSVGAGLNMMAPKGKAKAKAEAKAKARAEAKAKAAARADKEKRKSQKRVSEAALRAAAEKRACNGGKLSNGLTPSPDAGPEGSAESAIPYHEVFVRGFWVQTHACMLTFNNTEFTPDTRALFEEWCGATAARLGSRAWSGRLEQPLRAATDAPRYCLHAYLYWKGGDGLRLRSADDLAFQDYVPKPVWLDGWWAAQKLSHDQYRELSLLFRIGSQKRKRGVEEVAQAEREGFLQKHLAVELAELERADPVRPAQQFPETAEFVQLFSKPMRRRPILVIFGGTNLGESILAGSVLEDVAKMLHLPGVVEVTVEEDSNLDLAEFDLAKHSGVLLDGAGGAMMLKRHRGALQGRPKMSRGGKSATKMYSYPLTLCRRAVVVTMDPSAKNLHEFRACHWLSNPKNVVLLRLNAPAWAEAADASDAAEECMAGWTVEEVGGWLESEALLEFNRRRLVFQSSAPACPRLPTGS
ncbi:unnamed protein product [Prorocentrum cordatum]|uniref:Uncharacterized protein n=1 Tax=Prorocentrum cordatum TaxID=2364126 RepID=A0ABN9V9A6_9DINO|nr:unnamed protein product [Polarella glacialis]